MICFLEFQHFEIIPVTRQSGAVCWNNKNIGELLYYKESRSYSLVLKGIRFKDGKPVFAPGTRGKHFPDIQAVQAYLLTDDCAAIILEAFCRRYDNQRKYPPKNTACKELDIC